MALDPVTTGAILGAGKGLIKGKGIEGIAADAAMGAAGGWVGGKLPFGEMFSGVNSTGATTATNSLQGGANLLGGTGTAVGSSALPTAANASLLGSQTGNVIPGYDMGMNGIQANLGGFTAPEASSVVSNSYMPLTNSMNQPIGPDFSSKQTFINTTPYSGQGNFGSVQPLDNTLGQQMQEGYGYADGNAVKTNSELGPNFANINKSTKEELALAQGGYEKPLYERAFDSVVGFAEQNPMAVAGLGLTALSSANRPAPPITAQQAGKVVKGTYTPPPPYQMRRA